MSGKDERPKSKNVEIFNILFPTPTELADFRRGLKYRKLFSMKLGLGKTLKEAADRIREKQWKDDDVR